MKASLCITAWEITFLEKNSLGKYLLQEKFFELISEYLYTMDIQGKKLPRCAIWIGYLNFSLFFLRDVGSI